MHDCRNRGCDPRTLLRWGRAGHEGTRGHRRGQGRARAGLSQQPQELHTSSWLATTACRTPARKEVAVLLLSPGWGSAHHHAGKPEQLGQLQKLPHLALPPGPVPVPVGLANLRQLLAMVRKAISKHTQPPPIKAAVNNAPLTNHFLFTYFASLDLHNNCPGRSIAHFPSEETEARGLGKLSYNPKVQRISTRDSQGHIFKQPP